MAVPTPFCLKEPVPYAHQRRALQHLIDSDGVYGLLWEMGTGKTRAVIDYLGWLAHSTGQTVRVLITAPRSVQDTWILEAEKWASPQVPFEVVVLAGSIEEKAAMLRRWNESVDLSHRVKVEILVINYETLSSRRKVKGKAKIHSDLLLESVKAFAPHVLVCDEAHCFKNPDSNVGRLMYRIAKTIKRRVLLTGTPMPHSPLDVFAQFRVLDDQVFSTFKKPWTNGQFTARYAQMGGWGGKQVVGFRNLDELEKKMAVRSSSLSKRDCLDLPPVTELIVPIRLSAREQKAYDRIKDTMVLELESGTLMSAPSMLTLRLRLRQLACGFVKDDATNEVEWVGSTRLDVAVDRIEALLNTESRVVVFGWARPELDELAARLTRNTEFDVMAITGDTPDAKRLEYRQRFGKRDVKKRVLIAQWKTISMGVNELVSSSHAVFLSLSEQRGDYEQAKARLDRPGQTSPVFFHHLVMQGTIDPVILSSHQQRTQLEEAVMKYLKDS